MKKYSLILFVISLLIVACAQPSNLPSQADDNNLIIEKGFYTRGHAKNLFVSDSILYVSEDQAGFSIYNHLTSETLLTYRDSTNQNKFRDIYVNELKKQLFIVNKFGGENTGINCFDISNFSEPAVMAPIIGDTQLIAHLSGKSTEEGTRLWWSYADVFLKYGYYSNYWVADSSKIANYNFNVNNFNITEDYLFICSSQQGIAVVDRHTFDLVTLIDTRDEAMDVKVIDNFVYVTNKNYGISVYNIDNIENPEEIFFEDTDGWAQDVSIKDNILAIASGGGGIYVYDISNPGEPKFVGNIGESEIGYAFSVKINNNDIFVSTKLGAFKIKIK